MPRFRDPRSLTQQLDERLTSLRSEYSTWRSTHELLSEFLLPWAGRFVTSDRNVGTRRTGSIIDNTPTRSIRTLAANIMSGASSPARQWFRLVTPFPELNDEPDVQDWLSEVAEEMQHVIGQSNLNGELHRVYEEMITFGTACTLLLPDDDKVVHAYPMTAGQYYLATDAQGRVNTMFREFEMTTAQCIREFGYEQCSTQIQNDFDNRLLENEVTVVHAIEPRTDRDPFSKLATDMPWRSVYFEKSKTGSVRTSDRVMREGGYETFPVLAPRWSVSGGDVYGNGPGHECLGDAIQLQHEQERKGQAIDYQTRPPLQVPPGMKANEVDQQAGGVTAVASTGREAGIRNLFEVNLDLGVLLEDIADVRGRIRGSTFVDVFSSFAAIDQSMTASEARIRYEEKLLVMGPVLERIHDELLKPLIDLVFAYMLAAGRLPEPPESLADVELTVQFVSPLAQAQRAVGINALDRWLQTVGAIAGLKPGVLDVVEEDTVARHYADRLGVDPDLLADPTQIAELRRARAEQAQAQAQVEAAPQLAGAARDLAQAQQDNPLQPTEQFSGYGVPAG